MFQEYGVDGLLLWAIRSLYCQSQSLVCIAGRKSDLFPVRVSLHQSCPLSPVLFIVFNGKISRHSHAADGVKFGGLLIPSLLFADDMVLLASSNSNLQLALGRFPAECEVGGIRTSPRGAGLRGDPRAKIAAPVTRTSRISSIKRNEKNTRSKL